MTISRDDLEKGLPPIIKDEDGSVNVVLAVRADKVYCEENTYLPKWCVANTVYYNAYPDQFEGWIEVEDVRPPKF